MNQPVRHVASVFFKALFALSLVLLGSCGGDEEVAPVPPAVLEVQGTSPSEFGIVYLGTSSELTVTITNTGEGKAGYMDGSGVASPFEFKGGLYPGVGGTCDKAIEVDATCTIVVTFFPTIISTPSTTLVLSYNDGNEITTLEYPIGAIATQYPTFRPTGFTNGSDIIQAIAPATDGTSTIYMAGLFNTYNASTQNQIVRVFADGSIDTRFNTSTGFVTTVFALGPVSTGELYVGGAFTVFPSPTTANRLVRLLSTGAKDTTFTMSCDASVLAILPTTDGSKKFYAGGSFTACNTSGARIARFNWDGSVDSTFAPSFPNGNVNAIAFAPDGKLYVGGSFTLPSGRIVRLNTDGSQDTSFTGTGHINGAVNAIAVTPSGAIYTGGTFTAYTGVAGSARGIVRINADGTADTNFILTTGATGGFNTPTTVRALAIAPDNTSVEVGGSFTNYENVAVGGYARILPSGARDTTVTPGAGFGVSIYSMARAIDGSNDLYLGGSFTTYDGTTALGRIARITTTGTLE